LKSCSKPNDEAKRFRSSIIFYALPGGYPCALAAMRKAVMTAQGTSPAPSGWMGPPAFRFSVLGERVEAPAFSRTFKVLATAMMLGCGAALGQLWWQGAHTTSGLSVSWFSAGWLLMLVTWWFILRSRTRLDGQGLHQSWIWDKRMSFDELAYGKLIRVKTLEWLIAPRLYVRTLDAKFAVFYAASPELLAEFERLCAELKAFRRF
jgi:hypothetical protein